VPLQQDSYATCTYFSLLDLEKKHRNRLNPTNNLRVVLSGCVQAGADPANKFRGGAISVIFSSQVSLRVHCCKRDEIASTSQHCCDKTMDAKMALYREYCFPNFQNRGD